MSTPVRLRNGHTARVAPNIVSAQCGFELMGRTADGQLELWKKNGHWRQDDTEHPLDIVRGLFAPITIAELEEQS